MHKSVITIQAFVNVFIAQLFTSLLMLLSMNGMTMMRCTVASGTDDIIGDVDH